MTSSSTVSASSAAPKKEAAKPAKPPAKPKKGRVVIQDDADGEGGGRSLSEVQQLLREANEELAKRARTQTTLEVQLQESKEKSASLMRSNAKRLIQITTLEQQLDKEKERNKLMMEELVKQTKMMDLVINFRDQECAREVNEMLHENTELTEKLDLWKERAQMLQQERWGFVQKFRAAKGSGADGAAADGSVGNIVDEDEDDEDDDEPDAGSDEDW